MNTPTETTKNVNNKLRKQRRKLIRELIDEADKKLSGGYLGFSSEFSPDYIRLGPRIASLDASVTLRAIYCMDPKQARTYVKQKQPLKINGSSIEVAYLEMVLNAVSYMKPKQARQFVDIHPNDLEILSDEDYAFRKGIYKHFLGEGSATELAYPELLMVVMRHKDLSMPVGRKWIRNGLSLPGHSLDVGEDMKIIAGEYLGLNEKEAVEYELFGLLHDAGKLEVESEYLGTENILDEKGWASMMQHPSKGESIITALVRYAGTEYGKKVLSDAAKAARWHHENFDGSGYPDRISGKDIPLAARILRIADFWSAARAHRSYSPSMSREAAIEEGKRCSGQPYDEDILRRHQETTDPRYDRWKKGPEMEFDPEICKGGKVFEVLAEKAA